MIAEDRLRSFTVELYKINAIKFGEFKTKVGLMTPVYCDFRVIISYPELLDTLGDLLKPYVNSNHNIICGVPYTALPIATIVSAKTGVPMVMRRKEAKDYGTKKLIEGNFKDGDNCLIVEDVITSGSSILETINDLVGAGIKCSEAVVLLNREQGGEAILKENGVKVHALFTLTQLIGFLREANLIGDDVVSKVEVYLQSARVDSSILKTDSSKDRLRLDYLSRSQLATNPVAAKLLKIMSTKQTNLCLAADVTNGTDLLNLAERIGPHICLLKTHVDIIQDFNDNLVNCLQSIATAHNFILFEDRKFADIGKTVEYQYTKGIFQISSWATIVTVHSLTGKGVLDAVKQSRGNNDRGVFLLAETSAVGSLIDSNYTKETVKLALEYSDLVVGLVCQSPLLLDTPGCIQLTPGVQLGTGGDNLGQQYNSPELVVLERGADIAVVGRGITQADNPEVAAEKYKRLLWEAYLKRIK